ncbi:MAG: hypothetical protein H7293_03050 [Candidatus Saccharibacteria bacterium]|nr:hypothetical protein [Rhodoferax sp.]
MECWGVGVQRSVVRVVCAMAGVCGCWSPAAALAANLQDALAPDVQEAADLADASADSPVQRALSALSLKASTDKAGVPNAREVMAQKAAIPASASKPISPSLAESVHVAAKDFAVQTGAVNAKQYLAEELGLDKTPDADADADGTQLLRRRTIDNTTPPRTAEQLKLDEEQASFLASALVQEVMPWAAGAAVLLGSMQGLRAVLAFSRSRAVRKRKHRKSRSGRASRNARV